MCIKSVMPSNHLIPVIPFSSCFNLSQHQGLFQWVSSSHQVAKVLEFQLQSFQWLISFRIDWLDLLAVHEILKSLLQYHSSKASILQCSAFFMVQLLSVHAAAKSLQSCSTLCDPIDSSPPSSSVPGILQAPLSPGFSRQEHWSGLPFPSPGDDFL